MLPRETSSTQDYQLLLDEAKIPTAASIIPNSVLDCEIYLAVALKSIHNAISEFKQAELSLDQAARQLKLAIQANQVNTSSEDVTGRLLDLQFRTVITRNKLSKLFSIFEEFQHIAIEDESPENLTNVSSG